MGKTGCIGTITQPTSIILLPRSGGQDVKSRKRLGGKRDKNPIRKHRNSSLLVPTWELTG